LAWRVREKGFSIGYIDNAEVFHWGGQAQLTRLMQLLLRKKIKGRIFTLFKTLQTRNYHTIKKAERLKAFYRLITLKMTMPFVRDKIKLQNKFEPGVDLFTI